MKNSAKAGASIPANRASLFNRVFGPPGGGVQGLLGNPMFNIGLGLLQGNADPYMTPIQGLLQGGNNALRAQDFQSRMRARDENAALAQRRQDLLERSAQRPSYLTSLQRPDSDGSVATDMLFQDADGNLVSQTVNRGAKPPSEVPSAMLGEYTPQSIQKFQQTGDYSQLRPLLEAPEMIGEPFRDPQTGQMIANFQTPQGPQAMAVPGYRQPPDSSGSETAESAVTLIDELLAEDAFAPAFGAVQGRLPTIRSSTAAAEAKIDRLVNLLTLAERGKLKGQGTITDTETQMLARAQTILQNRMISDEEARAELQRLRDMLSRGSSPGLRLGPTRQQGNQQAGESVRRYNPATGRIE